MPTVPGSPGRHGRDCPPSDVTGVGVCVIVVSAPAFGDKIVCEHADVDHAVMSGWVSYVVTRLDPSATC